MIPPGHVYSEVLVSVPGTEHASDAVLLAQVPTTAIVNRAAAEAAVKVSYAGPPQFVVIPSTTMYYAVNTPEKVIRVGSVYYLCFQGIWFVSSNPNGPWRTADSVPAVIYTIPPASPMYNVTYVIVSNPTPTTVQTSYSSGYLGVFVVGVAVGSAIVYGTGYYYPAYVYYGPHPVYLSLSVYLWSRRRLQPLHWVLRGRASSVRALWFGRYGGLVQPQHGNLWEGSDHPECLRRPHLCSGL